MDFEVFSPTEDVEMRLIKNAFLNKNKMLLIEDNISAILARARAQRVTLQDVLLIHEVISFPNDSCPRSDRNSAEVLLFEVRLEMSLREGRFYRVCDLYQHPNKQLSFDVSEVRAVTLSKVSEVYLASLKNTLSIISRLWKEVKAKNIELHNHFLISKENMNAIAIIKYLCRGDEPLEAASAEPFRVDSMKSDFRDFNKFVSAFSNDDLDHHLDLIHRFYDRFIGRFRSIPTRSDKGGKGIGFTELMAQALLRHARLAEIDKMDGARLVAYAKKNFGQVRDDLKNFLRTVDMNDLQHMSTYLSKRQAEFPKLVDEFRPIFRAISKLYTDNEDMEISNGLLQELEAMDLSSPSLDFCLEKFKKVFREYPKFSKDPKNAELLKNIEAFFRGLISDCVDDYALVSAEKTLNSFGKTVANTKFTHFAVFWLTIIGLLGYFRPVMPAIGACPKERLLPLRINLSPLSSEEVSSTVCQNQPGGLQRERLQQRDRGAARRPCQSSQADGLNQLRRCKLGGTRQRCVSEGPARSSRP